MEKIKITCDSAADLNALFEENNIGVIPLYVNLGDKEFIDGVNITPEDIYKSVEVDGIMPKTAARNPQDFKEFFKQYTDDGYKVVHFSISDKISLMHKSACAAAKELAEEGATVYTIDSKSLCVGIGLLVLSAVDMMKEGVPAEEIYRRSLNRVDKVQTSFVINTMEYLYKGGRCSGLAAFAATRFKIKPSLIMDNGEIVVYNKYMSNTGRRAIRKYIDDVLKQFDDPDPKRLFFVHTKMDDEMLEEIRVYLKKKTNFDVTLENIAGSTITSHCGPATMGIMYINDGGVY